MTMTWPQGIMLVLLILSAARGLLKHGESDGKVNVWSSLLACAIQAWLLWWGGFWR